MRPSKLYAMTVFFIGVNTSQLCCGVTLEKASSVDDSTSNIKATVPPRQYSTSFASCDGGNRRPFLFIYKFFYSTYKLVVVEIDIELFFPFRIIYINHRINTASFNWLSVWAKCDAVYQI